MILETAKRLATRVRRGSKLEIVVRKSFINTGWNQNDLLSESEGLVTIGNNGRWRPDFVYSLPDKRKYILRLNQT